MVQKLFQKKTMTQTTIRFATPADVPAILGLIQELAEYEKMTDDVVGDASMIHAALFGGKPTAECLVAMVGDATVGMALYFQNFSTFLARPGIYLEDLYVQPEYRGQGIGKLLLTTLARVASDRECGRLEWSVLDWNQPSIDFYESLGAEAMSEWTVYRLTGDALQNVANLGDPL